ncbi:iron chaperone [Nitrospira sp. M1]
MQSLHDMILELYPDATVDMTYKMPTYRVREGWVAIANQKNYVALYTCESHHIEAFNKKYPNINTGKGCIRFKDRDSLPLSDVKPVVKHAIEHLKPHS